MLGAIATLPAGTRGVDAFTLPPGHVIADGGYEFASCYLANPDIPAQVPKILTPVKRDDLAAAGLGLMLNWEGSAGDPLRGWALGQWHGAYAERLADQLEAPIDLHVVISCDVNISQSDWSACDAYWSGFASETRHPLGAYVESDYMEHLDAEGLASLFWWPAASSWSGGRISPLAHVQQLVGYVLGNTCDANILRRETPFWFPNRSKALEPDVIPVPPAVEADMPVLFQCSDQFHWPGSSTLAAGDYPAKYGVFAVTDGGSVRHVATGGELSAATQVGAKIAVVNGPDFKGMLDAFGVYQPPATSVTVNNTGATKDEVGAELREVFQEAELNIGFNIPGT